MHVDTCECYAISSEGLGYSKYLGDPGPNPPRMLRGSNRFYVETEQQLRVRVTGHMTPLVTRLARVKEARVQSSVLRKPGGRGTHLPSQHSGGRSRRTRKSSIHD